MRFTTPKANRNSDKNLVGKSDEVLLIKVVVSPFDKYIFFQLANPCLIFSITMSQLDLALKGGTQGRQRYYMGREDSLHPEV